MGARGRLPKNTLPIAKPDVSCSPSKPSKEQAAQERRWKAEDALRTIQRAKDYEKDKQLMNDVKSLAQEQMNSLKRVAK